jgi:hypothetical protein
MEPARREVSRFSSHSLSAATRVYLASDRAVLSDLFLLKPAVMAGSIFHVIYTWLRDSVPPLFGESRNSFQPARIGHFSHCIIAAGSPGGRLVFPLAGLAKASHWCIRPPAARRISGQLRLSVQWAFDRSNIIEIEPITAFQQQGNSPYAH